VPPGAAWHRAWAYLFLSLPRGSTEVIGGVGRSEVAGPLGAEVSFFGFFAIFSLRCSLPMMNSVGSRDMRLEGMNGKPQRARFCPGRTR
jgi:hypothetical protein